MWNGVGVRDVATVGFQRYVSTKKGAVQEVGIKACAVDVGQARQGD